MTTHPAFSGASLLIPSLLAISLALSAGCSSKSPKARYLAANAGSACYAKAVPTTGEGGLAWGNTLPIARQKSLNNCIRYAGRSGGTPRTCKVVLAECK
ncbi:DUF4189 domain-containing protein [Pseudomonas sp. GD03860]|uniref:DUF4189 domain-containing protein n=1 Tax=Pseudomonas TaxID=286 RepID=UPI0023643EA4|nr:MULTISPECIES: DUF4189 domain-containing protein [Pseudomonas]MDD2058033.1 DUF4189 domain-containing protein [Pseudomonas putida]MDH0639490.1 DUF4189 domain-containing protein [Pseudomonas sp. GD03860]